jgi:hypothetical protein
MDGSGSVKLPDLPGANSNPASVFIRVHPWLKKSGLIPARNLIAERLAAQYI